MLRANPTTGGGAPRAAQATTDKTVRHRPFARARGIVRPGAPQIALNSQLGRLACLNFGGGGGGVPMVLPGGGGST